MHELGLAKELFEIIKSKSINSGLKKITKITIKVGEASGVEENFLIRSFKEHLLPNSIAETATIECIKEPIRLRCLKCRSEIDVDIKGLTCPDCGGGDFDILSGKDVYIESLEGIRE